LNCCLLVCHMINFHRTNRNAAKFDNFLFVRSGNPSHW
ncbi:hypothetical protein DOY81_000836, partial [Sarcophaga bullata]